jgi:hypothetical protein
MMSTPLAIEPVLLDLAACVCNELEVTGAGPTCWCGVYPGTSVSYEFCEECANGACGMAWVRPSGVFPYNTFPISTLESGCRAPLAWSVEVGCVRCLPTPSQGELPTPDQLLQSATDQMADAMALYRALRCCQGVDVAAELWTPIGPEGGCVGGQWTAYLAIE